MRDLKIAVVDLESTGPSLDKGDRIIQIGAVLLENGSIVAEYDMLINPERDIPQHITLLTGIDQEACDKAPTFQSVASLWHERLKDCVFVAHNLAHDLKFMEQHFAWNGFDYKPAALDTVKLAKVLFPQAAGFNLAALSQEFNLDFENAHNALADARLTVMILHHLAEKVIKLNEATLTLLLPLIETFDHQESLLFNNPTAFKVEDTQATLPKKIKEEQTVEKERKQDTQASLLENQAHYIMAGWEKQSHLIVESAVRPLKKELLFQLVFETLKQGEKSLIVGLAQVDSLMSWQAGLKQLFNSPSSDQEKERPKISLLLSPSHYINRAEFYSLVDRMEATKFNQQELITIGAVLVWLSYSKTGNLNELNHELTIQALLKRNRTEEKASKSASHYYFNLALEKAKKADLVLTNHAFLALASNKPSGGEYSKRAKENFKKVEAIFKDKALLVDDLSLLLRQLRLQASETFTLSQTLTSLQQVIDSIYTTGRAGSWQQELTVLEKIRSQIIYSMVEMEDHLRELFEWDEGPVSRELYIEPDSFLDDLFNQMKKELTRAVEELTRFNFTDQNRAPFSYKIKELLQKLKQLTYFDLEQRSDRSRYLILKTDQYQHNFYQITWIQKVLTVDQQVSDFLHSFKASLFMSPGNANYRQRTGTYQALGLNSFNYLRLASQQTTPIEMALPVDFLESKKDSEQSFALQIKMIASLLDQQWIEDGKVQAVSLLVVNNRQQALDAYRLLKKKLAHIEELMVLGQHVSGSLNKIKRYVYELKPVVVIIQWQSVLNDQWGIENLKANLYWVRLPFNSLANSQVRAKADYLKLQEEAIFSDILLPQMMSDWVIALDFFDQAFQIQEWLLLDERIYTKYYSSEIRRTLEATVTFNLKYEFN